MNKYPILLRRKLPDQSEASLIIDTIPTIEALLEESNISDIHSIASFEAKSRRRERLAWRVMLREYLQREPKITYLPSGKPLIEDQEFSHISISHCNDLVAVALSHRECGVDIERLDRNFDRVAQRYISQQEQSLATSTLNRAIIWSAKEVLYKMASREGLDLCKEITIEAIHHNRQEVTGVVRIAEEELLRCEISYYQPDAEHILLYHI